MKRNKKYVCENCGHVEVRDLELDECPNCGSSYVIDDDMMEDDLSEQDLTEVINYHLNLSIKE